MRYAADEISLHAPQKNAPAFGLRGQMQGLKKRLA